MKFSNTVNKIFRSIRKDRADVKPKLQPVRARPLFHKKKISPIEKIKKTKFSFFQRRYIKPFRNAFLIIVILIGANFAILKLKNSNRFLINSYKYTGIVKYVNAKDFEHVVEENIKDQNYFTFKPIGLENILSSNFLAIKKIKITKKFPDALVIQVQERTPIAVVTDSDNIRYLIDADGYVLGLTEGDPQNLSTVTYDKKLFVGQFIDTNIVPITLQILNSAKESNVKVSSVSFKPDYSTFYSGSTQVFLNNSNDIKRSVQILAQLLAQSALENKKVSKVDLRYDKVIVSYE